jgi:hypothetical protein
MNEDMYKVINDLWKNEVGETNLFKLKFVLTYFVSYLEEYLHLCEKRFQQLEKGDFNAGSSKNVYINQLQGALEGFMRMDESSLSKR